MRRYILITGVEFTNQGAYLMMRAAIEQIRNRFRATPVLDYRVGTPQQRRRVGTATFVPVKASRIARAPLVGTAVRRLSPFVGPADLYAVFDASGFRYGDEWKDLDLASSVRRYEDFGRHGVPTYLLPQALGPFSDTADVAEGLAKSTRMIFARDPQSFESIHTVTVQTGGLAQVVLSPDFTGAVSTVPVDGWHNHDVPIIPNWNIVARARTREDRDRYISALGAVVDHLRASGLRPYGLSHEGARDAELLEEVRRHIAPGSFRIVAGLDGLELKALIGQAPLIVSARYHAIASALSQGVPVVAHGWSHKYEWLLRDHECAHLLVNPYAEPQVHLEAIQAAQKDQLAIRLRSSAEEYLRENERMWAAISRDLAYVKGE